jgi:phospholipid/cholesterol/gamma-HCH transport system substrate-binding protein
MKISNETKVGALTAVSITLLILGFNFLKGKNVFKKKATMYLLSVKWRD